MKDVFCQALFQGLFFRVKMKITSQIRALFDELKFVGMDAAAVLENGVERKNARILKDEVLSLIENGIAKPEAQEVLFGGFEEHLEQKHFHDGLQGMCQGFVELPECSAEIFIRIDGCRRSHIHAVVIGKGAKGVLGGKTGIIDPVIRIETDPPERNFPVDQHGGSIEFLFQDIALGASGALFVRDAEI